MTDLGPAPPAPELGRIYEPIEREIDALNNYLEEEFQSTEPFVHALLMHIARFRGKQIRPACVFLAGKWLGEVSGDHIKTAGVVELIHTATLVHDDVLDDSSLRRRVETVNKRWGERAAVLLGDFIYSRGFSISTEVEGVSRLLADTTHTICEGELLQIGSTFDTTLSEERYNEIIRKKTASLYAMSCRVGGMLAGGGNKELAALEQFGEKLGMAFQIADDALDITGEEHVVGKSLGTDLKKGKMTLPLIRLRDTLQGSRLEEFMRMLGHPNKVGTHQRVVRMLVDNDIMPGVQNTASAFVEDAIALLDCLPASPVRESFEVLGRFIFERSL